MLEQNYNSSLNSNGGPSPLRNYPEDDYGTYNHTFTSEFMDAELNHGFHMARTPPPKQKAPTQNPSNFENDFNSESSPFIMSKRLNERYPLNPFLPSDDSIESNLNLALEGFDLTNPNRFFQPTSPGPTYRPGKPEKGPSASANGFVEPNEGTLVLYSNASRNPAYNAIMADPVNALFTLCHQRRLSPPEFFSKKLSGTKARPLGLHGMEVLVNGIRKSTAMDYDSQKEAEVAAALLGLQVLGIPVHLRGQSGPRAKPPPSKPASASLRPPFLSRSSTLDAMEPSLGTMGNTYFNALQRLLHRHYMIMPKLAHEALSCFPPRHLVLFEFYGQRFEAIHEKKTDAKQLVCRRAYEYFSKHPDFAGAPVDYRTKLSVIARAKKWHSPKFFDPSNGASTGGMGEMGVIIHDFEFIEKWPPELSSTGAKQLVAKKAYEYLIQMEQRTLPNVSKRLPLTCSVSQVGYDFSRERSSPFMKSRFGSGNQPSVRKQCPQDDIYNAPGYSMGVSGLHRHASQSHQDYDEDAYNGLGRHPPAYHDGVQAYDENDQHYYSLLDPHFEGEENLAEGDGEFDHGYNDGPNDYDWDEMMPHSQNIAIAERFPSTPYTLSKPRYSPTYYDEAEFISSHYTY